MVNIVCWPNHLITRGHCHCLSYKFCTDLPAVSRLEKYFLTLEREYFLSPVPWWLLLLLCEKSTVVPGPIINYQLLPHTRHTPRDIRDILVTLDTVSRTCWRGNGELFNLCFFSLDSAPCQLSQQLGISQFFQTVTSAREIHRIKNLSKVETFNIQTQNITWKC